MTRKSSTRPGKKLKVKKQTLKNLGASRRGVKGGVVGKQSIAGVCSGAPACDTVAIKRLPG